jgi:hypothetical protein
MRLLAAGLLAAVAGLLALLGAAAVTWRPVGFLAAVRPFLAGRPLPEPARTGTAAPDDYEGPP